MSLLDRMMARLRAQLTRPELPATTRIAYSALTNAGETVTENTALRQSVVWACLSYLSRTVAQLPWRVLAETATGSKQLPEHPVARLLSYRPNPEMAPFAFKETMVWWAASYGNAVAEIQRDQRNVPIALWPLHPDRVNVERDPETSELVFRVSSARGEAVVLGGQDVFHLRGYGDGPVGLNVVAYAAESIGWARATETFGGSYFRQGMAPSGIIATKGVLKGDGLTNLKNSVKEMYEGPKKSHKTLILDGDMTFTPLSVNPSAAQLVETRQHQVEEICRWFGVPPHKVMHLLRATFSNIEHQSIEVVVDSITPWALRLEQEADYKLFGANRAGLYTKLDLKGLLRGDYKSRQEGLQIMRRNGVISADEWREFEDMNPIGGEEGGKYIVEGNMTTLERVGEPPEPAATAVALPDTEDQAANDAEAEADSEDRAAARAAAGKVVSLLETMTQVLARDRQPPVVQVTVPEQSAPVVNVAAPIVNVQPPAVTVEAPVVNVAPAELHLEATLPAFDLTGVAAALREGFGSMPAPMVNVSVPELPAPNITIEVPQAAAPQITVSVPDEPREQIIERDSAGEIRRITSRRIERKH